MAIFDLVNLKKALNSAFLNWKTSKNGQNQNSKCLKILKNFEKISKNQTFDLVRFKKWLLIHCVGSWSVCRKSSAIPRE